MIRPPFLFGFRIKKSRLRDRSPKPASCKRRKEGYADLDIAITRPKDCNLVRFIFTPVNRGIKRVLSTDSFFF